MKGSSVRTSFVTPIVYVSARNVPHAPKSSCDVSSSIIGDIPRIFDSICIDDLVGVSFSKEEKEKLTISRI